MTLIYLIKETFDLSCIYNPDHIEFIFTEHLLKLYNIERVVHLFFKKTLFQGLVVY